MTPLLDSLTFSDDRRQEGLFPSPAGMSWAWTLSYYLGVVCSNSIITELSSPIWLLSTQAMANLHNLKRKAVWKQKNKNPTVHATRWQTTRMWETRGSAVQKGLTCCSPLDWKCLVSLKKQNLGHQAEWKEWDNKKGTKEAEVFRLSKRSLLCCWKKPKPIRINQWLSISLPN